MGPRSEGVRNTVATLLCWICFATQQTQALNACRVVDRTCTGRAIPPRNNQEEDLTKRSALRCPRPEVKNGVPSGNKSQGTLHRTAHARPNPCEALKAPRALQGSEQSWLGRLASAAMKPASACARRYIARTLVCDHRGLKRISILGLLIYSRTCLSQPKLESAVANASEPPPAR